jgi:MFS family permease
MLTLKSYREMDRNIWIRFIGESINGITYMMLMPFLALYLKDKVDHLWQVGIVMATSPLAMVFGAMIGGRLADIYGRKPIMFISMLGNGITLMGFVFFDGFIAFILLSFLSGLFNSLFHPAASAMVADVTTPEKRTEAFGLLRMGHNIGTTIGPLLGASVVLLSKSIIFMIAASSVLIYSLVVLFLIAETLPKKNGGETQSSKISETKEDLPSPVRVLFQDKLLFLYIMTGVVISMGFSQTEGMLPLHFDNELPSFSGAKNPYPYLMAFNGLLVVLFQIAVSSWASPRPMGRVMLYGAVLFGFGLLSVGWLPIFFRKLDLNWWLVLGILLVVYGIYTLGEMLLSPVQMTFVSNLAPEHLRGTYMGAASLQWIMGGVFGPLLAGFLLDRSLGNVMFTILGVGCLIAGVVYLSLDRWVEEAKTVVKV